MPLSVAAIMGVTAEVTATYEVDGKDQLIHVTYRPGWYTGNLEAELQKFRTEQPEAMAAYEARMLSELLAGWDVLEGRRPYPTTVEALSKLPLPFLLAVRTAIVDDLQARRDQRSEAAGR